MNVDILDKEKIISDDELIEKAQSGDKKAMNDIIIKYDMLVKRVSRSLFLYGAEKTDLWQIARLSLYEAVKNYDKSKSSFISFAIMTMRRDVLDAVKTYNRDKQKPLNYYKDISNPVTDNLIMIDTFEEDAIHTIYNDKIHNILKNLEKDKAEIFYMFMDGYSYNDIAEKLNVSSKKVDNQLQNIKNYIKKSLEENIQ
jgi:RNA polymerase sporulation-specific sigma factor